MILTVPKRLLHRWRSRSSTSAQKGFTLIELLIAIIIGSIITTTLLFIVLELLRANTREEALSQTQMDMRRAIDYITRDVSESVFVYDLSGANPVTDQLTDLPAANPVMAFWRLDPVADDDIAALDCATFPANQQAECEVVQIRRSIYTLVVYLQETNPPNGPTSIWEGPSRILRYELSQYSNLATLTPNTGYVDPSLVNNGFDSWTRNGGSTDGNTQVLTDYVDAINATTTTCPTGDYNPFPNTSDSFYVCVRDGGAVDSGTRTNQSLIVYLRGNAEQNRPGLITGPRSGSSRLPTLESEVLIRGVVEEQG